MALAAAWEVVAGVVMVVWCVPVTARIPMVRAIATSTPSAGSHRPGPDSDAAGDAGDGVWC